MTFVRALNTISDELKDRGFIEVFDFEAGELSIMEFMPGESIPHGDSVLECLNALIPYIVANHNGKRFEKSDDAVEYLIRKFVNLPVADE